jgi:hypothetical protein
MADIPGVFDFLDVMILALPGPSSGGPTPKLAHPPTPQTRLAALLVAGMALPGVVVIVGSGFLLRHSSNDLLAPVIGMVGIAGLGFGAYLVLIALAGAWAIWRRQPGARLHTIVLGSILMFVGPMTGAVMGGSIGLLVGAGMFLYGGAVVWSLLSPGIRVDFPGPLSARRARSRPRQHWGMSRRRG